MCGQLQTYIDSVARGTAPVFSSHDGDGPHKENLSLKRLFIVGAGGFGRELESWLDRVPEADRDWRICGYVDDNPDALEGYPSDYKVVGAVHGYEFEETDLAIVAIADPETKRVVVRQLENRVKFFSFVPQGTLIGKHVSIGRGVVIGLDCMLTTNIEVGDFAMINSHCSIAHDVRIGAYASLLGHVTVSGKCVIGESACVGSCSTLIPGRRIGAHATVGACAAVFRHVAPGTTVVGNPARVFLDARFSETQTSNSNGN